MNFYGFHRFHEFGPFSTGFWPFLSPFLSLSGRSFRGLVGRKTAEPGLLREVGAVLAARGQADLARSGRLPDTIRELGEGERGRPGEAERLSPGAEDAATAEEEWPLRNCVSFTPPSACVPLTERLFSGLLFWRR